MNPDGRLMRRFEREFKASMEQALIDMQDMVFSGLDETTVLTAVARLNQESIIIPFRDKAIKALQRIAIAGAEFGREQVERQVFGVKAMEMKQGDPANIDWQLANNAAAEWARRYGYDLVSGITATTRQRLQREISQFVQNQETMPELIERLEDVFGPVRAEIIGVTETTRAYAAGNQQAWKEAGIIKKQEWRTANDELRCPICSGLDGQIVGLDEKFKGGIDSPPAHPRCRCWIVPVTEFLDE